MVYIMGISGEKRIRTRARYYPTENQCSERWGR